MAHSLPLISTVLKCVYTEGQIMNSRAYPTSGGKKRRQPQVDGMTIG